ncbi:hypothetical protein BDV97DRAFT_83061 [Delphinella strobiligena]|nr:hypothetical protein BDV97DRAFT_83061 [Delphinella strobiligena]
MWNRLTFCATMALVRLYGYNICVHSNEDGLSKSLHAPERLLYNSSRGVRMFGNGCCTLKVMLLRISTESKPLHLIKLR